MLVKEPRYRKPLNSNQIRILKLIYKFRFVSVPLLSEYLGKDKSSVYENLYVLVNQDYIAKQYDSKTYRLRGKAATYFLANKGIRYLRENFEATNPTVLRNMYKNKAASEALVERSLSCLQLTTQLRKQYPGVFNIYSKSEMTPDEDILRPLPDLYLERAKGTTHEAHSYYVELLEPSVFSWIIRKRIQAHQDHADDLEAAGSTDVYPYVLFIATNDSTEARVLKLLEDGYQEFEFWVTTAERLASGETRVWREVFEESTLNTLG